MTNLSNANISHSDNLNLDLDIDDDGRHQPQPFSVHVDRSPTAKDDFQPPPIWHHKATVQTVVSSLATNQNDGLSSIEAAARLDSDGPNVLTPPTRTPWWVILFNQFTDFFSILLLFAAVLCIVAFIVDEAKDRLHLYLSIFLFTAVILTALFCFYQQQKSDRTLREFQNFLPPKALVLRDSGQKTVVDAQDLVVGDVVLINIGDKIPADVRILKSHRFTVDNSSLTGESEPIELSADVSTSDALEATNLAFFGCFAVDGSCTAAVIATGDSTVFGNIARLTASEGPDSATKTTLQRDIHHFVVVIFVFALFIGLVFFSVGVAVRANLIQNFVYSIGIIISNIPEGLLATVTVSLTASARRMARRNVLVKHLHAIETLGSTTVICTDKTGTLTQNKMRASHLSYAGRVEQLDESWAAPRRDAHSLDDEDGTADGVRDCFDALVHVASVCSTADFDGEELKENPHMPVEERNVFGDASEEGILRFAERMHSVREYRERNALVAIIPFSSLNRYMVTVNRAPDSAFIMRVAIKGAPERVLLRCSRILGAGGERTLVEHDRQLLQRQMAYIGSRGERVLAFAEKTLSPAESASIQADVGDDPDINAIPLSDMTFVGLLSLVDPPRPGVASAVQTCKDAGIKVIMVTGDMQETALSVAQNVGVITREISQQPLSQMAGDERNAIVVRGEQVNELSEAQWDTVLSHSEIVFARTSPKQKLDIVENLQRQGEIVTVTGDGCNDAPALKRANTGVAMGVSGSDVSRESAEIVILDDNFASIVSGVEEGRLIFDNLKKSIAYTLISNVPQLVPFIAFITLHIPLPFTTVLILCIDLGTDIFPAITLAYEKPENDIMSRPPRNAGKDRLMSGRLLSYSVLQLGLIQTVAGFFAYIVAFSDYGLGVLSLPGVNRGARFGTRRLSHQRWLFVEQRDSMSAGYKASWFVNSVEPFSKYFGSEEDGFVRQVGERFDKLQPSVENGGLNESRNDPNPAQFNNMVKIIAVEVKRPPCSLYSCTLTDGSPLKNDRRCFDVSKNKEPVTVNLKKTNDKVSPGTNDWEGCFELWNPERARYVERLAQTSFFAAIVVAQVFTLFACKTRIASVLDGSFTNVPLLLALLVEIGVATFVVYYPPLRRGLHVVPLKVWHWLPGVPFGAFILLYDEARKWFIRRHIRNESGDYAAGNGAVDRIARWVHNFTLW